MIDLQAFANYWLYAFDFYDFASFANQWQKEIDERFYDRRPDLNKDGIVDFKDFAVFASQWRQTCEPLPPDIQPLFNQDSNNLAGFVQISADIFDPDVYRMFILMDGEKYSEFYDFDEPISGIQTGDFANGRHSFKIVRIENDGSIICSRLCDVYFSNEISSITADSGFTSANGYRFYAFGAAGQSYNAEIKDLINDNVVYTSDFNDNINLNAAASAFTDAYHIYSVVIKRNQGGGLELSLDAVADINQQMLYLATTGDSTDEIVKRIMGRKFDPNRIDPNVKMAVSIGSKDMNDWEVDSIIIPAVIKAAVSQNLNPQYLPYEDCTWENLSRLLKDYPNVTYWYHIAHGSYRPFNYFPEQRTWVEIKESSSSSKDRLFSKLAKDYGTSVPPDYQWLGLYEDYPSIAELGFEENPKLEYIRMFTCYSAKYPDFAVAAGIISGDPYYDPLGERIYIGWKDVAYACDWYCLPWSIPKPVYYLTFEVSWFYQQGVGYSVGQAVTEAIMGQPWYIRHFLWNGLYPNIMVWGANQFYFFFGQ